MTTARTDAIDTTAATLEEAVAIELAEARAWADMYAAAPRGFAESAGVAAREVAGALVLTWAVTGRRYFSRTIGLGVAQPATEAAIDDILAGYADAGIGMFLLQSLPHCRPCEYESWLRARGLEPFDRQDRIVRGGEPVADARGSELTVERVSRGTADEWAEFLQRVYRLDCGPWLHELVDRPGWHQFVARDGGEIVAARGMHIGADGTAWLGMDGPVPGVMSGEYEADAAVCSAIVRDGLGRGARRFIADIEAPSAQLDTPAYEHFGKLGFRRPYVRTHWALS